LRWKW